MSVAPELVIPIGRFTESQRERVREARAARARTARDDAIEAQVRMIEADVRGLRAMLDAEDDERDNDDASSVPDAD